MSSIAITGGATGTGVFSLLAPSTSTDRVLTLPDATGTVLSTASTSVVTPAMLTQPLTLGTAVASTSGTSIDFNSIPSWAKRITVLFSGVSTNGSSLVIVRVGSGSVATTGYVSTISTNGVNATSTAGFLVNYTADATYFYRGQLQITLMSGTTYVASGNNALSAINCSVSAGDITLSGVLDRIRITTVNGTDTFDAGSINIMWE